MRLGGADGVKGFAVEDGLSVEDENDLFPVKLVSCGSPRT